MNDHKLMARIFSIQEEKWPLKGRFSISRGSRTQAHVVVVEVTADGALGRGESVPYARYGETVAETLAQLRRLADAVGDGLDRADLQTRLPPGAARNAVDCALWDLEAKMAGQPVHALADLPAPRSVTTAFTISLDTPEAMGAAARAEADRPILKIKLGGEGDLDRVRAVRANAPAARLMIDANEGWAPGDRTALANRLAALAALGVDMVEQPLPADQDADLEGLDRPVALVADESVHDRATLDRVARRYDAVNIKLDKTGGLTEALALKAAAEARGLGIMVGCMVATSLAMAPALLLADGAALVDLDGPLLLAQDREPGLVFQGSTIQPAAPALWG